MASLCQGWQWALRAGISGNSTAKVVGTTQWPMGRVEVGRSESQKAGETTREGQVEDGVKDEEKEMSWSWKMGGEQGVSVARAKEGPHRG